MARDLKDKIADIVFENTWEYGAELAMEKCQEIAEEICDTVIEEIETAVEKLV